MDRGVSLHDAVQQASPLLPVSHSSSPSTLRLPQKPPTLSVYASQRHTFTGSSGFSMLKPT